MTQQKITIILPTYNEAENLPKLAKSLKKALNEHGNKSEILVVDDNSPDGTAQTAKKLGLNIITRPRKLGLATAILEGIKHAQGELIAVMDADLQHPPTLLTAMLKEAKKGADIIVASRYTDGGKIHGWPPHRRLISRTATALAHLLIPKTRKVKDPLSGYFLLKRTAIHQTHLNPQGLKILPEILTKGQYRKVTEVPYTFHARKNGKSKLGPAEIWQYIKHLQKLAYP